MEKDEKIVLALVIVFVTFLGIKGLQEIFLQPSITPATQAELPQTKVNQDDAVTLQKEVVSSPSTKNAAKPNVENYETLADQAHALTIKSRTATGQEKENIYNQLNDIQQGMAEYAEYQDDLVKKVDKKYPNQDDLFPKDLFSIGE